MYAEDLSAADQALMNRDWNETDQLWRSLVEEKEFILIRLMPTAKQPLDNRWGNRIKHKPYERIDLQESMNAGIVCGPESGIIVLDVDDVAAFNVLDLEVPSTFTVREQARVFTTTSRCRNNTLTFTGTGAKEHTI